MLPVTAIERAREALSQRITTDPAPAMPLVREVSRSEGIYLLDTIRALWELMEDEGLIYEAAATVRRPA